MPLTGSSVKLNVTKERIISKYLLKDLYPLNSKKTNNLIKTWAKDEQTTHQRHTDGM